MWLKPSFLFAAHRPATDCTTEAAAWNNKNKEGKQNHETPSW